MNLLEELREFRFDGYNIIYPGNALDKAFWLSTCENVIVDVYQSGEFLRENDTVLDLGASIGSFSVVASKKVGKKGKVIAIEPDVYSYEILKRNIQRNNCPNIIPLNIGVAGEAGEGEITFSGRTYRFKVNSLENILCELNITERINFIKMDIEGYETEVISKNIQIFKQVDVISLEFHGTRKKLDQMLIPNGFHFKSITMRYIYKNVLKHIFIHPTDFCKTLFYTIKYNPQLIRAAISGFELAKSNVAKTEDVLVGIYIRDR